MDHLRRSAADPAQHMDGLFSNRLYPIDHVRRILQTSSKNLSSMGLKVICLEWLSRIICMERRVEQHIEDIPRWTPPKAASAMMISRIVEP